MREGEGDTKADAESKGEAKRVLVTDCSATRSCCWMREG